MRLMLFFVFTIIGLASLFTMSFVGPLFALERIMSVLTFEQWVEDLWPSAHKMGISRKTFDKAFSRLEPDIKVIRLAESQPEFVTPVWDYVEKRVSEERIAKGREVLEQYSDILDAIEAVYDVDRYTVISIWGLESNYGSHRGTMNVIRSLATLGYWGEARKTFGRDQLLAALTILQRGDISQDKMLGSWAGAMGHTQFIPTTYNEHAVDFDGDGRRDIWNTIPDALASTANYLKVSGWKANETWGYEVSLPEEFDYTMSGRKNVKPLKEWARLGLERVRGRAFPRLDDKAALILPAGAKGPAFLILNNFHAILRYNNSTAYALAVGHLADRLQGYLAFKKAWPVREQPLANKDERAELQRRLTEKGYSAGGVDGIIGSQTRDAVRAYQRAKGLPADGYPTVQLLEQLRDDG